MLFIFTERRIPWEQPNDGGVYILGDYSFDRAYMHSDELALLSKIQKLVKNQLSDQDRALLSQMIKAYTKTA